MRRLVDESDLSDRIIVDSAGTSSEHLGEPPDRRTIKEARRRGLDVERHRVWRFESDDFDRFDLVLVFVPDDTYGGEIPDPWFGGDDDFMLAFDLAEKACVALLEHLQCRQPS
jgi:protein-tyrosine phosphatase